MTPRSQPPGEGQLGFDLDLPELSTRRERAVPGPQRPRPVSAEGIARALGRPLRCWPFSRCWGSVSGN